ncbi:MAG: PCP reductase family protein [Nitrospirae bacterium]|nr:PCP reductase family protein [Nitrospirota bacterium]
MKFVCRSCETFMTYAEQEKISDGSLGITFSCPQCGHRFSMVTNPGETQMVNALGVKVGGRDAPAQPLEMTRQSLETSVERRTSNVAPSTGAGCPFPQMLAADEAKKPSVEPRPSLAWTTDAELRLERIPLFIRPMVQQEIERVARQRGVTLITEDLLQEVREQMSPK